MYDKAKLAKILAACEKATLQIPLSRGLFTTIDAEDYPIVGDRKWYAHKGSKSKTFYAASKIRGTNGQVQFMHRLLAEPPKGMFIDHKNGNGLDNRKCNLRICTTSQNEINKPAGNIGTSLYKGVYWHITRKKWVASIKKQKDRIYLGYYDFEEDAAKAYDNAALELFGEFAYLNFPNLLAEGGGE